MRGLGGFFGAGEALHRGTAGGSALPSSLEWHPDNEAAVLRLVQAASSGKVEEVEPQVNAAGSNGPVVLAALTRLVDVHDLLGIAVLVEASSSDALDALGRAGMDRAYSVFAASDAENRAMLEVMAFFSLRMNPVRSMALLAVYSREQHLTPPDLQALCRCVVAGSDSPLVTALRVAEFFSELSVVHLTFAPAYHELASQFTTTAIGLVDEVRADHVALLLLLEPNAMGDTAIDVALASRNSQFTGDDRVGRLMSNVWSQPNCMRQTKFGIADVELRPLVATMLRHPAEFARLPVGKYLIEAFSFAVFLAIFTVVLVRNVDLLEPISTLEWVLYSVVSLFVLSMVRKVAELGPVAVFRDSWNAADALIYVIFATVIGLRMSNANGEQYSSESFDLWSILMATNAVFMWLRVSFVFLIHPTVGPLLRAMRLMVDGVKSFAILMAILIAGFALAFHFLLRDLDPQDYETITGTCLTLFRAMLSDFDFGDFASADDTVRHFLEFLMCVFLFVASILALNMLIAMMWSAYEKVQDASDLEFKLLRVSSIARYDSARNELPAPFDGIAFAIYLGSLALDLFRGGGARVASSASRPASAAESAAGSKGEAPLLGDGAEETHAAARKKTARRKRTTSSKTKGEEDDEAAGYVEPFICGYCHHSNSDTTMEEMQSRVEAWVVRVTDEAVDSAEAAAGRARRADLKSAAQAAGGEGARQAALVSPTVVLCENCCRPPKPLDELGLRREKISAAVFVAVVWLPLFLLLCVPYALSVAGRAALGAVRQRHLDRLEQRVAHAIRQSEFMRKHRTDVASERRARERAQLKEAWVRRHFASEEPKLEDVVQMLRDLKSEMRALVSSSRPERDGGPGGGAGSGGGVGGGGGAAGAAGNHAGVSRQGNIYDMDDAQEFML